jgi:hypothetical protein
MFFIVNMMCFSICTCITNPTILDISLQKPYNVGGEERDFRRKFSKIFKVF